MLPEGLKVPDIGVWTAIMSQSGTDDPIIEVLLHNTLPNETNITWVRNSAGDYQGQFTNSQAFDWQKIWTCITSLQSSIWHLNCATFTLGDQVKIQQQNDLGTSVDGWYACIEIRVYK